MVAPWFADRVSAGIPACRRVVADAARAGVPTPALSSSPAWFDALRAERLPAALIQGLRDNFGAHTYRRVDREGSFHTLWAQDRSDVEA
jgi:6-phosphogluconate dehydrogenase